MMVTRIAISKFWRTVWQNPITVKELRSRMRERRAFFVLTIYLSVMALIVSLVYFSFYLNNRNFVGNNDLTDAGEAVFISVLVIQAVLVVFGAPVFTSNAITGEKERQTYEILRTTLLPAKWLIAGKLLSGLSYVILLIFVAIPIQSIAFLLGGVTLTELLMTQAVLIMTTITFSITGLYLSVRSRSTLETTILSLAFTVVSILIGPIFLLMNDGFGWDFNMPYDGELFLSLTNLAVALANVINEDRYRNFSLWPSFAGYLIIYAVIAGILFIRTVHRIKQVEE